MKKPVTIGVVVLVALVVVALLTLRVTGLEPRYIDPASEEFARSGRTAWPGLWLSGEVVREPVTNWDFVEEVDHPIRGNSVMLETRTWYGIPHSVTIFADPRGDELYVSGTEQGQRLQGEFPHNKAWWANLIRDPRVRMKIDGRIYEFTAVHIADRAELARIFGRDPVTTVTDADGTERVTVVRHAWRLYQRNVPEYGDGAAVATAGE